MKPLTESKMLEKICPMSITGGSPNFQTCIGKKCMLFQEQYTIVGVRKNDDIDFEQEFVGYYCGLSNKRSTK